MPQQFDRAFGGLIPSDLKRMTRQSSGSVTLTVESTDHDLSLLRAVADAVRVDDEIPGLLVQYAEVLERLDEAERNGQWPLKRSLEDEATDLASVIDGRLEWANLGDEVVAHLGRETASELETALEVSKPVTVYPVVKPEVVA